MNSVSLFQDQDEKEVMPVEALFHVFPPEHRADTAYPEAIG
ncbi:MAG: hypothetical protein WDN75_19595 [Bacteroidota bacterium]